MATDRSSYDTPARAIVLTAGALLVLGSLPFAASVLPSEHAFDVTWSQVPGASVVGNAPGAAGQAASAPALAVTGLTSSLMVTVPLCNDAPSATDQAAIISWTVTRTSGTDAPLSYNGQLTCAQAGTYSKEIPRIAQPDIAKATGTDKDVNEARTIATASVWSQAGGHNETATYQLTVTYTRASAAPAGLPPLPGQTSTLAATVSLMEHHWAPALNPHQEVGK